MDALKKHLLEHLDSVFYGKAWHGASLMQTIRRIGYEQAILENQEGFCAWGIALHCAYWKFDVRRQLLSASATPGVSKPLRFERKPVNFPRLPEELSEKTWKEDRLFLEREHALLREAVAAFPSELLSRTPARKHITYEGHILGAAAHDVYHTAHIRNLGVISF